MLLINDQCSSSDVPEQNEVSGSGIVALLQFWQVQPTRHQTFQMPTIHSNGLRFVSFCVKNVPQSIPQQNHSSLVSSFLCKTQIVLQQKFGSVNILVLSAETTKRQLPEIYLSVTTLTVLLTLHCF